MTLKVRIHKDPQGGFWAEVPALPGCMTQGETPAELEANLREAIVGWLQAGDVANPMQQDEEVELIEMAV